MKNRLHIWFYSKVGQALFQSGTALMCYKVGQVLLQTGAAFLHYNTRRVVLQYMAGITKWGNNDYLARTLSGAELMLLLWESRNRTLTTEVFASLESLGNNPVRSVSCTEICVY